jgi:hypothetical protein
VDQREFDDLELQLTYVKIEDDYPSRRTRRRSETLTMTSLGKPYKLWQTKLCSKVHQWSSS